MATPSLLVVDDDHDTCASMSDVLVDLGYEVNTANDGLAALKLVEQNPYQLALLDYRMPGMNGLELFHRIRQVRPALPTVFVTAFAATETMEAAKAAGVRRVLSKPINFGELIPVIQETVGKPN